MGQESSLEAAATRYAGSKGIWTRKFVSPANRSVPDRVFGFNKTCVWIEFKAPGKKPTDAQADEIAEMRARGLLALYMDDLPETKRLLDDLAQSDYVNLEYACSIKSINNEQTEQ